MHLKNCGYTGPDSDYNSQGCNPWSGSVKTKISKAHSPMDLGELVHSRPCLNKVTWNNQGIHVHQPLAYLGNLGQLYKLTLANVLKENQAGFLGNG